MDPARLCATIIIVFGHSRLCTTQVLQFGPCVAVVTQEYFELERFLGTWYEIEGYPTWYASSPRCAYVRFQACGRRVEVEHGLVRDEVRLVLRANSTYAPGGDAVFAFNGNSIDPIGIPLYIISTDYTNYALTYGCRSNETLDIKYLSARILSREKTLAPELLAKAYRELNSLPNASTVYLERMEQEDEKCPFYWTAHVHAEELEEDNVEL